MIDFFCDPLEGLGLFHVFDRFDAEITKNDIIKEMTNFLQNKSLDDVFVYICSHGYKKVGRLHILLRTTQEDDPHSHLDFDDFIDNLRKEANCRVYCIVDCCESGIVHEDSTRLDIPETAVLPKAGTTILTANNRKTPGSVIAEDNLRGIDAPLFSHLFFQVVKKGEKKLPKDGISFEHICQCIRERIPKLIRDLNLASERQNTAKETCGLHGEDADLMQYDRHRTNIPDCSDRPYHQKEIGKKLSQVLVFKNNAYPNMSRDMRNFFRQMRPKQLQFVGIQNETIKKQNDEIRSLKISYSTMKKDSQSTIETLRDEISTLEKKESILNERIISMDEEFDNQIGTLKSTISKLRNETSELRTENQLLRVSEEMLEAAGEGLRARIDLFERENGNLKSEIIAMNNKMKESESEIRKLRKVGSELAWNAERSRRRHVTWVWVLAAGVLFVAFALAG